MNQPRVRNPDAGSKVACIVITVIAAACVVSAFANKPDAAQSGGPPPLSTVAPTAGGGQGVQGGGSTSGSPVRPTVTKEFVENNFPVKPGWHRYSGEDQVPDHQVWIEATGTLTEVEDFYTREMPKVGDGVSCTFKNDIKDNAGNLLGGSCTFAPNTGVDLGYMQVRRNVEGEAKGIILVQGFFQ